MDASKELELWWKVFRAWAATLKVPFDYDTLTPERKEKVEKYIKGFDFSKQPIYNSQEEAFWFQKETGNAVNANGLWANRPRFRFIVSWLV